MFTVRALILACSLAVSFGRAALAEDGNEAPRLGSPMTAGEIAQWDKTIFPDGRGLPPGQGTAKEGRVLYEQKCASCHGAQGEGGTAEDLIGIPVPPTRDDPSKTIGAYWPFATTVFDFISRSMPPAAPGTLSADGTYAITAYLLTANKIITDTDEMTAATLPKVKMPNRNGFVWIDAKRDRR